MENNIRYCGSCDCTDGFCYTSNPPQCRCMISNDFHYYSDACNIPWEAYISYKNKKESGSEYPHININGSGIYTNGSITILGEIHNNQLSKEFEELINSL